jgi:gamma-glutamyltranspeptidase/glutathione hydrolase
MVAVDGDGCWVSSIQSVAGTFGSQVLEPTTGILAHNRGSGFSLDPDHPGYLVGGRRPPHTLMPCLVRRDGQTVGALATMGGHNQPFILTQVLARILAGDHPQQAVAAPRWVVPRGGPTGRVVIADERVPAEVLAELSADASIEVVSMIDNRLGHSHAIWDTPDGWAAGTDPRADGEPG